MYPDQFNSLLAEGGITLDNIPKLSELSTEWFKAEPSLTTFILRAIFRDLYDTWYDPQGIPLAAYTPFHEKLLPQLEIVAQAAAGGNLAHLHSAATDLVPVYHACLTAVQGQ